MPFRGDVLCSFPSCGYVGPPNRCPVHGRNPDDPTGYNGADWKRRSAAQLAREPTCRYCGKRATTADHIRPRTLGGSDADANLQSLCTSCHSKKSASEREFMRRPFRD